MKFFIGKGILFWKWDGNVKVCLPDNKRIHFSIPNYSEEKKEHKDIRFSVSGITEYCSTSDLLLEDVSLKAFKDTYTVNPTVSKKEHGIYALIRSTKIVPDDVYIPTFMKDKVRIIKHIRFVDVEPDYGDFLSNVYLIKINLNVNESLPVYLTSTDPYCLNNHHVFYRSDEYGVMTNLKTYITLNRKNCDDYISLSKLV